MSIRSGRPRRASISASANNDPPDRSASLRSRPVPASSAFEELSSSHLTGTPPNPRGPARSFVSQSPLAYTNPADYSSTGVRDQTAELASFTFSQPGTLKDRPASVSTTHPLRPVTSSRNRPVQASPSSPKVQRWDDSTPTRLPHAIQESPEPGSPHDSSPTTPQPHAPSYPPDKSNLTSLFQRPSSYASISRRARPGDSSHEEPSPQEIPEIVVEEDEEANEQQPLLGLREPAAATKPSCSCDPKYRKPPEVGDVENQKPKRRKRNKAQQLYDTASHRAGSFLVIARNPKRWSRRAIYEQGLKKPISLLPCVFLGLLLNVLDALSYGMILFPLGEPIFAQTGADGISMFYVSCIVAQLVYSCGGSIFKGAVGSEMIEVVPFFHKMTYTVMHRMGTSNPHAVLATVIVSFAMSSVLTGIVFFGLGAFRLGSLVSFFPRHILIGCVGGVGFFLFVTGIEVSARLDGNLEYTLETAKQLFQKDTVQLWIPPLALAIALMIVQRLNHSPFVVPAFFVVVAVVFYIVIASVGRFDVALARSNGWIFEAPVAGVPFYNFYSYYDFKAVNWSALAATIPSMLALTFFGVLHVPINIPALAIVAEEDDLNLNRELVAHGFSNAISGFVGSIQNYLVYVNSQMFIQNGGNSRLAGLLLAAATSGVWIAGPTMIGYVPVMVVGALIYYLGIELLEEALWDTWGKMAKLEYLTVVAIVLVMGIYDFVAGILVGIVLACLNFVVQTSRKSAIRATYNGEIVESTVRRHPIQRHFLREVGYQIYVTKLAGFLFFGSIVRVEKQSRALIEEEAFNSEPIRYLIFDLAHVNGMDFSAAEAFSRMERVLARRQVKMIISGVSKDSEVGKSMRNVGLWTEAGSIRYFETLNNALEFCENELLKAFYSHQEAVDSWGSTRQGSMDIPKNESPPGLDQAASGLSEHRIAASPRQRFLQEAATNTLEEHTSLAPKKWHSFKQPLPLILQTFQELTAKNEDFWGKAMPYFERHEIVHGTVLFSRGQDPDAFYLLEQGMLHAHYTLPVGNYQESIVAGTTCGELPFFSETARTATVSAEKDCITWRLSKASWEEMQKDWPEGAQEILRIAMKLTKERFDGIVAYVLTTAG